MRRNLVSAIVGSVLGALGGGNERAFAQDTIDWANVEGWIVAVDRTVAGCFAWAQFEGGTIFRIGINAENRNGYLIIANDDWRTLEIGKDYVLEFQFGSARPWQGEGSVVDMHGEKALVISFKEPDLALEFMKKQNVVIRYRGKQVDNLNLRGSFAAFMEVLRCQEEVDGKSASGDPFDDGAPTKASDPFSQ